VIPEERWRCNKHCKLTIHDAAPASLSAALLLGGSQSLSRLETACISGIFMCQGWRSRTLFIGHARLLGAESVELGFPLNWGAVRVLLKNFFLPWTLLSSILTFVISNSPLPFAPLPFSQRRLLVRNSPSASPSSHLLPAAGPRCHSLIFDF
jgi:hypothetical protein